MFRSKVISDMLVVLFIGGLGLFPNNIFLVPLLSFFLSAATTTITATIATLSKALEGEREEETRARERG